jgi:Transposase DDE domain.
MEPKTFFLNPGTAVQKQYEALRAFYIERLSTSQVAEKFKFSESYFKKLRYEFNQTLNREENIFFFKNKARPEKTFYRIKIIEEIISLRKQNHSITDIRAILASKEKKISLETIDQILKSQGFAPLPKRTHKERTSVRIPAKIKAPESLPFEVRDEEFSTEMNAAILIFLPLIEELGIVKAIEKSGFPKTSTISSISSVLSFITLKIIGNERLSHDTNWNMDRILGFGSNLNVLPKNGTLSTYSYRIQRSSNQKLLLELSKIFKDDELEEGEFNLDYKAIPHWGDASVLKKHWSGSRNKAIKSILALIVQDPSTGYLSYSNAECRNKNDAVIDFVDFWKESRGAAPKLLIFDSKFTDYKNLNRLNQSKEKVKFLTIRRRGKNIVDAAEKIAEDKWTKIRVDGKGRKVQVIKVHERFTKLRNYEGKVREIIMKDHGRQKPTFLITNDLRIAVKDIVKKYARRWLVEKEIAEQIAFFHMNQASSSIVVKVDFDLTISLLVHNLLPCIKQLS